ncbi:amylo-alpha-1,6-glucosidase [Desulfobacter vibrioformis]|uniref:amylo-alpha-1,6-glucosidase n=1 Tax=Desulfobacter vibrioformis TaxID=34031 RepID=UPI0005502500|nr:amylo-alpha-1,6-glucosidase [Desulfobacter vibrioformis]
MVTENQEIHLLTQSPPPGTARVLFCGDIAVFTLFVSPDSPGRAFVRTNMGNANAIRREIIHRVEKNGIKLGEAWHDLPMKEEGDGNFSIRLPLVQTGSFQAKCFFLPRDSDVPVWPEGDNTTICVEPAGTCCANIIYNAFVRQFGPTRDATFQPPNLDSVINKLDNQGFTVIPKSGKFRDLKEQLNFIFSRMGCRAIHLLPIHPTPTTYARMGRFGSPYAALDFSDVDPALAQFDPAATPLEQFMELVDAVHDHDGYLILDIAINHTGWAASLHESHPEWLDREDDGKIRMPGAWGVVWADLTKLDYRHTDLWQYMADIFLLWCRRGVDGFRCDAGYMIPEPAWEYIIAKVRSQYPDTVFFLEGLGGPPDATRHLLQHANFNWAYSELFQEYSLEQISRYIPHAIDLSNTCGHLIHFAETHDNDRLAKVSHTYAKMRTGLCALFSICGGFGFTNGVEWFAREKINVHNSPGLNWGNPDNQVDYITRLHLLLREHPAFFSRAQLKLIHEKESQALALLRFNPRHNSRILVLVNLDCDSQVMAVWPAGLEGGAAFPWTDLISGDAVQAENREGKFRILLKPGAVLALSPKKSDLDLLKSQPAGHLSMPGRVLMQKRRALALEVITAVNGHMNLADLDVNQAAMDLTRDPETFIRRLYPDRRPSRTILFDAHKDVNRRVMVPPGFFLLVRCSRHFRVQLEEAGPDRQCLGFCESLPAEGDCGYQAIFMPMEIKENHRDCLLKLRISGPQGTKIITGNIRYLPPFEALNLRLSFTRREIAQDLSIKQLSTTRLGAMMRAGASFSHLESRYDALLGANLNPNLPENRWMLLSRFKIWGVFQGYSRELGPDCLDAFWASHDQGGKWRFRIPSSEGRYYVIDLFLEMDRKTNTVTLTLHRETAPADNPRRLQPQRNVTLIIRPDIEDRSFHDTVKAFSGPEQQWPPRVSAFENGFFFHSQTGKILRLSSSRDAFFLKPEWQYMVHRNVEATRGLDADSDLFSPGYFSINVKGGDTVSLKACVIDDETMPEPEDGKEISLPGPFHSTVPFFQAVQASLDAFIVDRGEEKSVVAGYPWFLDWGRDSLIFCRSLIEIGRTRDAFAMLSLFGKFEKDGTLPNMICGDDARNIETSDAPLWFFACCRDLTQHLGKATVLTQNIGQRTMIQVLKDMASSMIKGTPTGVKADPESMLLYSPAHFTWMDTNFPAGTPRQGYPIEIQALWCHALQFLSQVDDSDTQTSWKKHADTVKRTIMDLFWREDDGFFSDCLHCSEPVDAGHAAPDDALRPNQLLLITLGVINDQEIMARVVETCRELLVPGGIRSLADRPLAMPLFIERNGQNLADPHAPYAGYYQGDEDTQRKPAYHNGTAWTWQFPVFCEAWATAFGPPGIPAALAWLGSALPLMRTGAAGFVPEILDGNFPHTPRGCDAQAWGSSEIARVAHKLTRILI